MTVAPCDQLEREGLAALLAPGELDPELAAHFEGCEACRASRERFLRIARAMREVGAAHVRRPDHLARLWARLEASPQRRLPRWRWIAGPAVALAAAVVLVVWLGRGEPAPELAVDVIPQGVVAHRGEARLGDRLRVRARAGAAIWIYRNDRELLRACPRDCRRDGGALIAELPLDAIGRYQVVWLASERAPAPGGDLERDVAAASAAGVAYELRELSVE